MTLALALPSIRVTSTTGINRKQINLKKREKKEKKKKVTIRFSHTFIHRSGIISVTVERQNDAAPFHSHGSVPVQKCETRPCRRPFDGARNMSYSFRSRNSRRSAPADNRVTCTLRDKSLLHKYRSKLCNRRSKRPSSQKALLVASLKAARLICNFLSGSTLRAS